MRRRRLIGVYRGLRKSMMPGLQLMIEVRGGGTGRLANRNGAAGLSTPRKLAERGAEHNRHSRPVRVSQRQLSSRKTDCLDAPVSICKAAKRRRESGDPSHDGERQ